MADLSLQVRLPLELKLLIRWLSFALVSALPTACNVSQPSPIVVQVEVTQIVVVTSTPKGPPPRTPEPTPTFTVPPILTQGTSGWYENLTQAEMAEIALDSTRLYTINSSGQREPILLSRIDERANYNPFWGLDTYSPIFYGIVVDYPKLEQLPVTDYNGNESILGIYTVPYMIQTSKSEYVIKDVILGAESLLIIGYANVRVNVLPEYGPSRWASMTVQEVVSNITANRQYPMRLRHWDNEEVERSWVENNPGSEYFHDLFVIHRTYGQDAAEFINALVTGGDIHAFEETKYLSQLSQIIFNLDD